jgi:stearoyl-CoA desaturase (Delta-9 desaturase)
VVTKLLEGHPTTAIPGVRRADARSALVQRRLTLFVTIAPLLGFAFAIWSLWGHGLSLLDLTIFLAFYVFTGLGVSVGLHRLFTHGSFETTRSLRGLLAIAGSMAVQGPVITWVANHRRHHAFSDREGDPHSPHLDEGPGVMGVLKGLWHAHLGWLFGSEQTLPERWSPDLLKDPMIQRINKLFGLWVAVSFGAPALIGFALTGHLRGALSAFLWGGLARIFFLHHVTWSINSICHFYGDRPFQTTDFSTNNWALSLISFGESWHNNHHAFPTSARHGIGRGQLDLSASLIALLSRVGLARAVKVVSPKQLARKISV